MVKRLRLIFLLLLQTCVGYQLTRSTRRFFLSVSSVATIIPAVAHADDPQTFNSRLNKMVTKSGLGLEVRRSVVKGAQVFDSIDGSWEKFSDRNGLGSQRKKQPPYPIQSPPPPLLPLDSATFAKLIGIFDAAFLLNAPVPCSPDALATEVDRIKLLVKPSFDRMSDPSPTTFEAYCRFRAYCSLSSSSPPPLLRRAKNKFALSVGSNIITLLNIPLPSTPTLDSCNSTLLRALEELRLLGLLARATLSDVNDEAREDFADGLDTTITVAVDTDIFQSSTILLSEQGFRLFTPSLTSFLTQYIFSTLPNTTVDVTEYFMDTNYNSDPDKFEVKQVLVNCELKQ
ncbi:hypothetical protein TrCOL_g12775 [Triparma columacea]|uniref:Uncharacterized protein n=2 Tax=Triparma columacea TaxID=722753 RepID=A0A9W7GAX4_9STRA|nr:hypothetical protein TrCOL_g12775 [Triparma columacea]